MSTKARRCKAKTKVGKPCRAAPLKGGDYCLAHDTATRAEVDFGGPQPGAGRPRKAKPAEIEKRLLESHSIAWMRPYWRILGFDVHFDEDGELALTELPEGGAKLYGESKTGEIKVSGADDLGAQMAAAEKLRDRVFGRPKSTSEFTGTVEARSAVQIDETVEREIEKLRAKFVGEASPPELSDPSAGAVGPAPEPQSEPQPADDAESVTEDAEPADEPTSEPTPSEPEPDQPEPEPRKQQQRPSWLRRAELEA